MALDDHGRTRATTVAATGLFALTVVELLTAVTGAALAGMSFVDAVGSYLLTNCVIGVSCAVSGLILAWHRPRNPVGWLLAGAGVLQTMTAAVSPLVVVAHDRHWPTPVTRSLATLFLYSWPWSIGLLLPLALLLFPTGTLPSRRWRWVTWIAVPAGLVFVLAMGSDPGGVDDTGQLTAWLVLQDHAALNPLWFGAGWLAGLAYVAALAGLVVRYRSGGERLRRQLSWLLFALLLMLVVLEVWGPLVPGLAVLNLLVIALVPVSMTIAVLRYELLDIRLALARTVVYTLLTGAVVGAYLLLVAAADLALRRSAGLGTSVLATLVIALGFNPLRLRLQRVVDRALYGDRSDPVRALSRMGEQLTAGDQRDVLQVVTAALRLPYAAVRGEGIQWADSGTPPARLESVPLRYRGDVVGDLIVGVRAGQGALTRADRSVLELLAGPLAVAVHATTLSADLQSSRERIVGAREEERRRLRRDLHDGLGPVLTGIAFQAEAARNLVRSDPGRAEELLATLRVEAADAIDVVRRMAYALHPPSLAGMGLAGALRRQVEQLQTGSPVVTLDVPESLPVLPAAVEVAAYRIAVEALTNAVRHAGAQFVGIRLHVDGALEIAVDDDGAGGVSWQPGVGLTSMRERAAELGGIVRAAPDRTGGHVIARLPLPEPAVPGAAG
jgi:two-component system, NarL family, sensor kinase